LRDGTRDRSHGGRQASKSTLPAAAALLSERYSNMACCEYVAKRRRESRARFSNNFATKRVRILVFLAMRPDTAGQHMHDAPHMFMHAAGGAWSRTTHTIIAIALDPIAKAHAVVAQY